MFFELSKNNNKNFVYNYSISPNFFLNLDEGWSTHKKEGYKIYFKGYCEKLSEAELCEKIIENNTSPLTGNFTAILETEKEIKILHDNFRSYPVYFDNKKMIVTNLFLESSLIDYKHFMSFDKITESFSIKKKENGINIKKIYSFESVLDKIDNILNQNIKYFIENNKKPLKLFLTGGIDSLLVYSYIKKYTKNFEILDYEFRKWTRFSKDNWGQIIKTSHKYTEAHSWGNSPCVIMSGHHGDEFFMRELLILLLFLENNKKKFEIESKKYMSSYSSHYFSKKMSGVKEIFNNKKYRIISLDKDKTKEYCINIANSINFIWHLDQTIYYTPLKNLEIIQLILNLPADQIIKNAFCSNIQLSLIERNDKDLVKLVMFDEKNHDSYEKVIKYLKKL